MGFISACTPITVRENRFFQIFSIVIFLISLALNCTAGDSWTTTGSVSAGRFAHSATKLQNGKVLIAGGYGDGGVYLATCEIYGSASFRVGLY